MTVASHSNESQASPTPTPSTGPASLAINIALFYAGWFGCVYALAWQQGWLGPLGVSTAVGVHLFLRRELAPQALRRTALSILAVMLLGPWIEGSLALLGVVSFPGPAWLPVITLVSLWGVFATTFDGALGWLEDRLALSILFGAIGAPPTYYAAERLGALSLDPVLWKWLVPLALLWGLGFPALMRLARFLRSDSSSSAAR